MEEMHMVDIEGTRAEAQAIDSDDGDDFPGGGRGGQRVGCQQQ